RHLPAELRGLGVDLLGESQTVNALDQIDDRKHRLDLVALEVADHVPAELVGDGPVAVGQAALKELVDLCGPLGEDLNAAFAQVRDAELEKLADLLRGGGFRDGNE